MKTTLSVTIFSLIMSSVALAKLPDMQEGYYGNTVRSDDGTVNGAWYIASSLFCGYKLTWLDRSKKSFSLERGMNPLNGAECDYDHKVFTCDDKVCYSDDYKKMLLPTSNGFNIPVEGNGLVHWSFVSTKDPTSYLFPASQEFQFAGSNLSSVDELCEYAKETLTNKSLQTCQSAGYAKCDIIFSEVSARLDITRYANCTYTVVTRGK